MTTFNADDQLRPPPSFAPDPDEMSPPPAPTAEEREAGLARVRGTAAPADEHPAREFRDGEPRSEGAVGVVAPDPAPEVVDAEPVEDTSTVVAIPDRLDVSTLDEGWQHDWLEFKGDKLGIRLPTRQALAAFSLASSKYVSLGVKNDLTGLFIARHLSPESYGRVFSRLMDPDETDYDVDTVGELFNAIVTAAVNADKADEAK